MLGVLIEKAKTTPDSYPMSLNALVTGCNQKSNREPVLNLSEDDVEEEIEVKLRNHKAEPVDVTVKENLYRWSNWTLISKTHEFEKNDSRTISFPVTVPKNGETVVRYRVRYTW